jgi:hypothetical protein
MLSEPLAQVEPVTSDALIVAVPALDPNVAKPAVVVEKLATVVSVDAHDAELVTSLLFRVAVNC